MIPPKYNFYVGTIEYMTLKYGQIDLSGNFISDENYRSSNILAVPKSRKIYFMNSPLHVSSARISYYDSAKKYKGYNHIIKGISTIGDEYSYYAVSFQYNDTAFSSNNFLAELTAVNPHYKDLSKKYAKENGQEFFRISLDGKIDLFGDDYEIIKQSNLESQFVFIIEKYNRKSDKYLEYYKGEFSKTDCKFDHSKKKCELKIVSLDEYNEIMNKYDNVYDLVKLAPEITKINLYKRSLVQVYIRGADSVTNFFAGTYWEDDINEAISSHDDLINKYHFMHNKTGNEFYIRGANVPEVNGVYAGMDGVYNNGNGYTCKLEEVTSGNVLRRVRIYRDSDNTLLYQSMALLAVSETDNMYIPITARITMRGVIDTSITFPIENIFEYHIYSRILCDIDSVQGISSTYDLPSDDFVVDNRNFKKCIGLNTGSFFCTSRTVDEPTKYGLNDYGQYFTNQFIPPSTGLNRPLPVSKNSWANASLWFVYQTSYLILEEKLRKQYVLRDSYSIGAAIKAILKKIAPNISHEPTAEYSQFLYGETNPLGLAKFYVHIAQKTNILKGNYDQPAQKAEISLGELMKMLRDCFRCYWYIENNKLKIEHVYFFMNGGSYSNDSGVQLDFTKLVDQFNKRLSSYFQSEIEYDKSNLNQRYEFGWMDNATNLFGGAVIDIKSNYVQKDKVEEINATKFSSDVDFMLFNPSNFSNDGFALLCPIKNGSSYELPIITVQSLIDENGDTYTAAIQNWYASWIYLQNFYMWDMPAKNIESNTIGGLLVKDVKKCMKHTIEFPTEEDLDKMKLIKTAFGDGQIDEVSIDLNTRKAKARLLYRP